MTKPPHKSTGIHSLLAKKGDATPAHINQEEASILNMLGELQLIDDPKTAAKGRYGDELLAYITPEKREILKSMGGAGTINPETGLPEYLPSWLAGPDSIWAGAANTVQSFSSSVGSAIDNIIKNPIPTIEMVALMYVGVPPEIAAPIVTGINGGKPQDIIKSAAIAYASTQISDYAGNEISPIEQQTLQQMGPQYAELALVKQIVTSATGAAAATALRGQGIDQILNNAVAGAVSGAVSQQLATEYGLNTKDLNNKLITNSVSAATRALLNGKSLSDAVAQSATATALTAGISSGVDSLKSWSSKADTSAQNYNDTAQKYTAYYDEIKPEYDRVTKGAESGAWAADAWAKEYDSLATDLKNQYSTYETLVNRINTYDYSRVNIAAATFGGTRTMDINYANQLADRINSGVTELDKIKAHIDENVAYYNSNKAIADNYLNTLNGFKSDLDTYAAQNKEAQSQIQTISADLGTKVKQYEDFANTEAGKIANEIAPVAVDTANAALEQTAKNAGYSSYAEYQKAGINLAAANTGTASDAQAPYEVTVGGVPIYAESSSAKTVSSPFGYQLLSMSQADEKPEGAYYDITQNAWFTPTDEVKKLQEQLMQGEETGELPPGWAPADNGNLTFTSDDGSTITFNSSGDVVGHTDASTTGPTEPTPTGPTPTEPAGPTEPTPTGPTGPTEPAPTGPTEPAPTGPTEPTPTGPTGPTPTEPTGPTGEEPQCAAGYHWNGSMCVSDDDIENPTTTCPDGYLFDLNTQSCVPVGTETGPTGPTTPPTGPTTPPTGPTGPTTPPTGPTGPTKPPTGPTGPTIPTIPTPPTSGNQMDLLSLLALLGAGGGSQAPTPPPTVDIGQQLDLEAALQTNPFAKQQTQSKMATGGSIDDLLAMLQQRG